MERKSAFDFGLISVGTGSAVDGVVEVAGVGAAEEGAAASLLAGTLIRLRA